MFTGLVSHVGQISSILKKNNEAVLFVQSSFTADQIKKGDSIAVNGACLTVESFEAAASGTNSFGTVSFSVYASEATLAQTNLGWLKRGSEVNLELALALGDRLDGHLVSGHVDCLVKLLRSEKVGQSRKMIFSLPAEQAPFVVPKGSVCLDGISLTVNDCEADFFSVNIIPGTLSATTIALWKPGYLVNLETDMLGKYVARLLANGQSCAGQKNGKADKSSALSRELLAKNGFI